ncbi:MAG: PEGA domain-containing protein, partial [Myxococcota bacterium]
MHTHLPLSVYPPVLGLLLLSTSCSLGDIYLSHTTPMEQAVSVQRLPSAALAVDGPAGALVFIDGVAVGTAPLQARVEPGMRVVVVS